MCSLCVTVCPNRANQAYESAPTRVDLPTFIVQDGELLVDGMWRLEVRQGTQIVNIADFCNDCGNCTTFCPAAGDPYKDKPRFWIDREGFEASKGDAFRFDRSGGLLRIDARLDGEPHSLECRDGIVRYRSPAVVATFERQPFRLLACEPARPARDGEEVDLSPCGTLVALLESGSALPCPLEARR
jgi:putative selenate reductase